MPLPDSLPVLIAKSALSRLKGDVPLMEEVDRILGRTNEELWESKGVGNLPEIGVLITRFERDTTEGLLLWKTTLTLVYVIPTAAVHEPFARVNVAVHCLDVLEKSDLSHPDDDEKAADQKRYLTQKLTRFTGDNLAGRLAEATATLRTLTTVTFSSLDTQRNQVEM